MQDTFYNCCQHDLVMCDTPPPFLINGTCSSDHTLFIVIFFKSKNIKFNFKYNYVLFKKVLNFFQKWMFNDLFMIWIVLSVLHVHIDYFQSIFL